MPPASGPRCRPRASSGPLKIARSHNSDKERKVTSPLDPEAFFIEEPVTGVDGNSGLEPLGPADIFVTFSPFALTGLLSTIS